MIYPWRIQHPSQDFWAIFCVFRTLFESVRNFSIPYPLFMDIIIFKASFLLLAIHLVLQMFHFSGPVFVFLHWRYLVEFVDYLHCSLSNKHKCDILSLDGKIIIYPSNIMLIAVKCLRRSPDGNILFLYGSQHIRRSQRLNTLIQK